MPRPADEEKEADRLYQLPLAEFTRERNSLAKELGGDTGKRMRALQKPSTAAWAANQLYWRDRPTYEALIAASQELRAAHKAVLGGRKADLREVDARHREAMKAALASTLRLLAGAGQNVSSATHTEISRTLESLPAAEPPGRLTQSLLPGGFEALQGLPIQPRKGAAAPRKKTTPGEDKAAAERARKEAERVLEAARRQERHDREAVAQLRKQLNAAERAAEAAKAAWERAEQAEARARKEFRQAEESLERTARALQALRGNN